LIATASVAVAPAVRAIGCRTAQVGGLTAPEGPEVSAQESTTVPANPLPEATATVEVAALPATIAAGGVALKEKVGNAGAATVMATLAVWDSAPEVAVRARA